MVSARVDRGLRAARLGLSINVGLVALKLVRKRNALVKVLGVGELTVAVTVHAHKFSRSAQEKIEKAGGKAILIGE